MFDRIGASVIELGISSSSIGYCTAAASPDDIRRARASIRQFDYSRVDCDLARLGIEWARGIVMIAAGGAAHAPVAASSDGRFVRSRSGSVQRATTAHLLARFERAQADPGDLSRGRRPAACAALVVTTRRVRAAPSRPSRRTPSLFARRRSAWPTRDLHETPRFQYQLSCNCPD